MRDAFTDWIIACLLSIIVILIMVVFLNIGAMIRFNRAWFWEDPCATDIRTNDICYWSEQNPQRFFIP